MAIYPFKVEINPAGQCAYGCFGFKGLWTLSGYSLVTNGFLWLTNDQWVPTGECEDVVWEDCACASECD